MHIKICENIFLIINTRWCKMKVKCLKKKNMGDMCYKMCKKIPESKTTPLGEHVIMANI
jgi:hypothetical protein